MINRLSSVIFDSLQLLALPRRFTVVLPWRFLEVQQFSSCIIPQNCFIFIFNVKYSKIINKFEKLFFSEEILICSYLYLDPALSWDYQELLRIQGSDYHCRDHFHHQGHHESHIMIIMWMKAIVSFIHEPFHLLKMVKYGSRCRSEEVGSPHRHHHHHQQHHHLNGHDDHRCRSEEVGSPRGSSAGRGMSQSAAGLQVAMMIMIMIMGSR